MAGHDFKESLIAEIERAVREREDSLRVPRHVLLITLRRWAGSRGADGKTLERALSELRSEGRVVTGPTINDTYIDLKEEDEE